MNRLNIRTSRGFTLLEVLITVVIFSVGLLGLAGLQATGIKLNHSSLLRTQATLLAYDIADGMRANRDAAISEAYDIGKGDTHATPSDLAQTDVRDWKAKLDQLLPAGDGSIDLNGRRATIDVEWDDTRGVGDPKTFTLITDI